MGKIQGTLCISGLINLRKCKSVVPRQAQPVNLLMAWMLIPCRCSSFSSCTSLPLNNFRNLLRVVLAPVYHVKGWGKFNRHYEDFCPGADKIQGTYGILGLAPGTSRPGKRMIEFCIRLLVLQFDGKLVRSDLG